MNKQQIAKMAKSSQYSESLITLSLKATPIPQKKERKRKKEKENDPSI